MNNEKRSSIQNGTYFNNFPAVNYEMKISMVAWLGGYSCLNSRSMLDKIKFCFDTRPIGNRTFCRRHFGSIVVSILIPQLYDVKQIFKKMILSKL